jgi:hypothetical protein
VKLTKVFSADRFAQGLESWGWLDFSGKEPIFTSLFGDAFFASATGCWFLDTIEGTLTQRWESRNELDAALRTNGGRDHYLMEGLAAAAEASGVALAHNEVYDFRTPPVLGGSLEIENLASMDFAVALNIAGQIHGQVRDLPPGTPIGEITIRPRAE